MRINKRYNQMSMQECKHCIDNFKKIKNFNALGFYRSILENSRLTIDDKIEIRDYANLSLRKTYEFLQLKDPATYFELFTLGQELVKGNTDQIWENIRINQEKILKKKRIKHRNFGDYAKHDCGLKNCPMNGMMVRQGSHLALGHMWFDTDKNEYHREMKARRIRKERKMKSRLIREQRESE